MQKLKVASNLSQQENDFIITATRQAWQKIAPWWPLKNLIATNPLQGLEALSFEQAFVEGSYYFQNTNIQKKMADVNRETIKWCQVFFDEGQATISMPNRKKGIYNAWRELIYFDDHIHRKHQPSIDWLDKLPLRPEEVISVCLKKLGINESQTCEFMTLLLSTISGWAGYIKYQTDWTQDIIKHEYKLEQIEFLAMRMLLTCLLYPAARELIYAEANFVEQVATPMLEKIVKSESQFKHALVSMIGRNDPATVSQKRADVQIVFCIDVRSEPFRRAIEAQGNFETLGFAGFFGIPVAVEDALTGEEYASCPVLLSPKHKIRFTPKETHSKFDSMMQLSLKINAKKVYQALKYTFTAPFALAEGLGPWSGLWMTLRTLLPNLASKLKPIAANHCLGDFNLDESIAFKDQCRYAEGVLRSMGLTSQFADLVVFCGHGSSTVNNAYGTALDCGACGGHAGATNATILSRILNEPLVRMALRENGIEIPVTTTFLSALHNTTTDEVTLFSHLGSDNQVISNLKNALDRARSDNCKVRHVALSKRKTTVVAKQINRRSIDWSETRPEWGLAGNASFIVAPRSLTKEMNLHGRSFLHSYDWRQDADGSLLSNILTAPMVVAQWINCQYLFSTVDNIAYGSGSKITHNITGKIGVMQGNASDLMTGLPLQSVNSNDRENHHEPLRLLTVVQAPRALISEIIVKQEVLRKLFGNGWVYLTCIEPNDGCAYDLQRNFTWTNSLSPVHDEGVADYV